MSVLLKFESTKDTILKLKSDSVVISEDSSEGDYSDDPEDYTITPSMDNQILPTKGKRMANDLHIEPVPVYETSNPEGGMTVYIAS